MALTRVNSTIQLYDSIETMFNEHKEYIAPDWYTFRQKGSVYEVLKNREHYCYTFNKESALAVCKAYNS